MATEKLSSDKAQMPIYRTEDLEMPGDGHCLVVLDSSLAAPSRVVHLWVQNNV